MTRSFVVPSNRLDSWKAWKSLLNCSVCRVVRWHNSSCLIPQAYTGHPLSDDLLGMETSEVRKFERLFRLLETKYISFVDDREKAGISNLLSLDCSWVMDVPTKNIKSLSVRAFCTVLVARMCCFITNRVSHWLRCFCCWVCCCDYLILLQGH